MLAAARRAAGLEADLADLRDNASAIDDWPEAIRGAREHGLLVLLGRDLIAAHVASSAYLTEAVRHELDRSLAHVRVLRELTVILSDAGVNALAFKGPVLSLRLYGDAATRISADLDIVVARRDYSLARSTLLAAGFSPHNEHSAWREEHLFRWLGHASFHRNGTDVELHWRFSPIQFPLHITAESAYTRGEDSTIGGVRVRGLSDLDNAVVLSAHAARHLYERLEWLSGIVKILTHNEHRVTEMLVHSRVLGAERALLVTAQVAHIVLGMPLNDTWSTALAADEDARRLAADMASALDGYGRNAVPFPEGGSLQMLYSRFLTTRRERTSVLVRTLLMPTEHDWQSVRLPDVLVPLYWVIRPARLALSYAGRLFGTGQA